MMTDDEGWKMMVMMRMMMNDDRCKMKDDGDNGDDAVDYAGDRG